MTFLFWSSLALIAFVYAGYPAIMRFLAACRRPRPTVDGGESYLPPATLVIAAFNEERAIHGKLINSLSLDYPRDLLEIVVVSDGSTDRTDAIVASFQSRGVRLIRLEGRQGKTAAQNAAAAAAGGEILVFSDANAFYNPDAIRRLVRPFANPDVGCVEGRRADAAEADSATARHELRFRDWESRLKEWESRVLSCTGATGPIYAVRRSLYVPLNPDLISDFMQPLLVMARHRKRQVYEPRALSRELVFSDMRDEFRRKVRIMTRCLNSLKKTPEVLAPRRVGVAFAAQVISHRLLRWLTPVFALTAFTANLFLLDGPFYRITLLMQAAFLLAAGIGWWLDRRNTGPACLRLPYTFSAANAAALVAIGNCLMGRHIVSWSTRRP